ncbi:MAG: hypothetical protein ACREA0_30375, partial [bacterium]
WGEAALERRLWPKEPRAFLMPQREARLMEPEGAAVHHVNLVLDVGLRGEEVARVALAGTLHLDPGQTKNKAGRVVHLIPELKAALEAQLGRVPWSASWGGSSLSSSPTPRGTGPASSANNLRKVWLSASGLNNLPEDGAVRKRVTQ